MHRIYNATHFGIYFYHHIVYQNKNLDLIWKDLDILDKLQIKNKTPIFKIITILVYTIQTNTFRQATIKGTDILDNLFSCLFSLLIT